MKEGIVGGCKGLNEAVGDDTEVDCGERGVGLYDGSREEV